MYRNIFLSNLSMPLYVPINRIFLWLRNVWIILRTFFCPPFQRPMPVSWPWRSPMLSIPNTTKKKGMHIFLYRHVYSYICNIYIRSSKHTCILLICYFILSREYFLIYNWHMNQVFSPWGVCSEDSLLGGALSRTPLITYIILHRNPYPLILTP
jgi:hypothetical protein